MALAAQTSTGARPTAATSVQAPAATWSGAQALATRMTNLLLQPGVADPPETVSGVVEWFGAMQAQDGASGMFSLGSRLPAMVNADVHAALERREALRTWPMRGTVHLVPARDAKWMVTILGERPLAAAASRRAILGLPETTADRAVEILTEALAGGRRLTRSQCVAELARCGVENASKLAYHLLWYASQRGVTCVAPDIGKEQTFVLLDEWVPEPNRPERDEALGIMALRYFRSHGPTTRQDFAGWIGMTAADAKLGIAVAGKALATVDVEGTPMLVDTATAERGPSPAADGSRTGGRWLALPGFDEYLLGFKDRSLMVEPEHKQAIIPGNNGIFQPTLVRDGRVVGIWKRAVSAKRVKFELRALAKLGAGDRRAAQDALLRYSGFIEREPAFTWIE